MTALSCILPRYRILAGVVTSSLALTCQTQAVVIEGSVTPLPWNDYLDVSVGDTSWGSLLIESGEDVSSGNSYIGKEATSNGEVTVSGASSRWNVGNFTVGSLGSAILTIENGGAVNSTGKAYIGNERGSSGTVTVTGIGSQWNAEHIQVSYWGSGVLIIENGGKVTTTENSYIGGAPGSSNSVTVTGDGSRWDGVHLFVAGYGVKGALTIENQGAVALDELNVGYSLGDSGTTMVTGAGSTLETKYTIVGSYGTGLLTIEKGGVVTSTAAGYIGINNAGYGYRPNGTAIVTGDESRWDVAELVVGGDGTGTLIIEEGGIVNSTGSAVIGSNSVAIGTVIVTGEGSSWDAAEITVGRSGSGTLTIEDGGLVQITDSVSNRLSIGTYGVIQIAGGFLAWNGDHYDALLEMILIGNIQYWDGVGYASLVPGEDYAKYFKLEYISDSARSALSSSNSNLSGLDGYTILTAVPEPATYAAILSVSILGIALRMKRRNYVK